MKLDKNMVAALLGFGGGKGGGIVPSGALSISANGTYDVGAFASAVVAVPASAVVSGTKSISANGTHDVTAFANAEVLVPASAVCSGTKSISENGTHDECGGGGQRNNKHIEQRNIQCSSICRSKHHGQG